jgi:hypothetical protein
VALSCLLDRMGKDHHFVIEAGNRQNDIGSTPLTKGLRRDAVQLSRAE